ANDATIDQSFITNYNPLESDSKDFGRELFLSDINIFILNGWKPLKPGQVPFKFDFATWKSITALNDELQQRTSSITDPDNQHRYCMETQTLRLCFSDDAWCNRAAFSAHKDPAFSYANAKKGLEIALQDDEIEMVSTTVFLLGSVLHGMGYYQEAKKVIEPGLRYDTSCGDFTGNKGLYEQLLGKTKDEPTLPFKQIEKRDPLQGYFEGFCTDTVRKVRSAYIKATERVYATEAALKKLCSDVDETSPPEAIAEIVQAAMKAELRNDLDDARRLYSIAHIAAKRRNPYVLFRRAHATISSRGEPLLAYIDATEAIKLNPSLSAAYECKAVALNLMGFVKKTKQTLAEAKRIDAGFELSPETAAAFSEDLLRADKPDYPEEVLTNYDPLSADFFVSNNRLTAAERKILKDVRSINRASSLIGQGKYAVAINCLKQPIKALPQPYVLTMRGIAYLQNNEPVKALDDAQHALRLDQFFHDAMLLQVKALVALGLYMKARRKLRSYQALVPENAEAKQISKSIEGKVDEPKLPLQEVDEIDRRTDYDPEPSESENRSQFWASVIAFIQKVHQEIGSILTEKKDAKRGETEDTFEYTNMKEVLDAAANKVFTSFDALKQEKREAEAAL
ncbi:hypothetical protein AAVH_41228, partial [Aphelenchoides avenae]